MHTSQRDPEWACLPRPELSVLNDLVTLSRKEALEAQVAALRGFVVDTVRWTSDSMRPRNARGTSSLQVRPCLVPWLVAQAGPRALCDA